MFRYTAESSINLLINLIATIHFHPDQCIAYYNDETAIFPQRISPLSQQFPVVINDYECKHGCRQYIVENSYMYDISEYNPFGNCMIQQRNTDMKVIIILSENSLDMYRSMPGDFGINVVIIIPSESYYYIIGHEDLTQTGLVLLNRWSIIGHRFTNEPGIDKFFDARWKKDPNACINLEVHAGYRHIFYSISDSLTVYSVDINIVYHFAMYLKVRFLITMINENILGVADQREAFLLADRTSNQVQFPQTYPATTFSYVYIVPKPG